MSRRFVSLAVLTGVLAVALVSAQPPISAPTHVTPAIQQPILTTLRPGHPRLLVLDADLSGVRAALAEDIHVRRWHERLRQQASQMLEEPLVERTLVGPRLLTQSRAALHRIATLAGLFLIDGDPRMLARAKAEMRAVAAFSDWNPSHFLDVAEMTAAMALGYDWLYSDLTADERELFRAAIISKGLTPGVEAIRMPSFWAAQGRNTWSEVCFGGLDARRSGCRRGRAGPGGLSAGRAQGPAFRHTCGASRPTAVTWKVPATGATRRCTSRSCCRRSRRHWATTLASDRPTAWRRWGSSACTRSERADDSSTTPTPSRSPRPLRRCSGWPAVTIAPSTPRTSTPGLPRSRVAPSVFHVLWSARPPAACRLVAADLRAFQER